MKKISTLTAIIFLINQYSFSQTGPGGVGNSTSNVIWLDASQLSLNNGDPVSTWSDRSGNGNDFTQGTPSYQPTFRTNQVNTQPIVDFNQDYVESSAIAAMDGNDFSQFIVSKADNNTHTGYLYHNSYTSGAGSASNQLWGTYITSSGNEFRTFTRKSTGASVLNNLGYQTGYSIISSVISSGSSDITGYFNNNNLGSTSGYNASPSGHNYSRLGVSTASLNFWYYGNIAEVIVYNTALNSAQQNIVSNYLSTKYRRTISGSLYSHIYNHRYEVFGVGQEADGSNSTAQGTGIVEFSSPTLANGDYILTGHDNGSISTITNDVPASLPGTNRLQRVWRVDATGTPGTLTVSFDISGTAFAGETSFNLVVETDNGVFNDGGTTDYGPATPVGNIVTFTGVSLPDDSYFSLIGPSQDIQTITSGNWSSTSTWSCSCIPTSSDDATIKAGHTVTLDAHSSVQALTIEATGALNFSTSRQLYVYGDLSVAGSISANSGVIDFKGAGTLSFDNTSGSTLSLYNLVVSGGATVELETGVFEIINSTKVSSGVLSNVSGTVTLVSDNSKTAVTLGGAPNAYAGTFIVQRFISQRNASWGDLSSPVANLTLGQWDSDETGTVTELYMSNVGGVDGAAGNFYSVYDWNETTQVYDSIIDTSYVMPLGMGVEVWLEDENDTLNDKTFDSRGTPNSGAVVVAVQDGWNLVGNPYAAWVLWTPLLKPTLSSTYYIWNTNTASYDAKTNGSIPPHQGFWVESTGSGNLTFKEKDKYAVTSSIFWKTTAPSEADIEAYEFIEAILKIRSNDYPYAHDLKLRLNEYASLGLDEFDASFKPSRVLEAPSITSYSSSSNKELVINSFNLEDEVQIPVSIKVGITGTYTLEAIDFSKYADKYEVIQLLDHSSNIAYNLKDQSFIELELSTNELDERFTLRMSNDKIDLAVDEEEGVLVYSNADNIVIEISNLNTNYDVTIHNLLGQELVSKMNNSDSKLIIPNDLMTNGVNIITIKLNNSVIVKKIKY